MKRVYGLALLISLSGCGIASNTAPQATGAVAPGAEARGTAPALEKAIQHEFEVAFHRTDSDHSGSLDAQEMKESWFDFEIFDANDDGKVTLNEYTSPSLIKSAVLGLTSLAEQEFVKLDANRDKSLSREEIKTGHPDPKLDLDFNDLDANHDGKVTPPEFKLPVVTQMARKMLVNG